MAARTSANHAEVGACGVTQLLRLMRMASGTGLGALHEVMGDVAGVAGRCQTLVHGKKTGDLGKNADHIKLPGQC